MTTLLAVTGLSPAIVTETLWALAKQKPAILPDRVIFITTSTGKEKLEEQLFTPLPEWKGLSVWDSLRKTLKAPANKLIAELPTVISMADSKSGRSLQLDDIRTPEQNAAAAEFIFSQVWNIVRDKDQRLIASVAGGRKTMGALLHSAVSLIGRSSDLITHILVDPPFDNLKGFFFPDQPGGQIMDSRGNYHNPKIAKPLLAEVPFVSLRNRFKELDDLPGSFLSLRAKLADALTKDANREIPIKIMHDNKSFMVDGYKFKANPLELAVLEFILRCHIKKSSFQHPTDSPQEVAADAFVKWVTKNKIRFPELKVDPKRGARLITHTLSSLRKKLENASWQPAKFSFMQAPFKLED